MALDAVTSGHCQIQLRPGGAVTLSGPRAES